MNSWVPLPQVYDRAYTETTNIRTAVTDMTQQLAKAHEDRGLKLWETSEATVQAIADQWLLRGAAGCLRGPGWTVLRAQKLRRRFVQNAMQEIRNAAQEYETMQRDPLHVPVNGLADRYRAWQVVNDPSVDDSLVRLKNYWLPTGWERSDTVRSPPGPYVYWGAEVITPVYDVDNVSCFHNIIRVVHRLREELRIHKPMSAVENGLHIHFGHQDGWTLLQLKRCTTMWLLLEETLYALQRAERSNYEYCWNLREHSELARALGGDPALRSRLPEGGTLLNLQYDAYMNRKMPMNMIPDNLRLIIQAVWRYPIINSLTHALGTAQDTGSSGIRYNTTGYKRTDPCQEHFGNQTLEVRIMQGTLDAEHV